MCLGMWCIIVSLVIFPLPSSAEIEQRYQQEMKRLEMERLQELEEETAVKQLTLDSNTALQNLDKVEPEPRNQPRTLDISMP